MPATRGNDETQRRHGRNGVGGASGPASVPTMLRTLRTLSIALCCALAAAGCGDDADDDTMSFSEWQEGTSAVCEEYEPRVQARAEAQPEVETADDLVALIDAVAPLNVEYTDELLAVGVPDERGEEVTAMYESLRTQEELALAAREAAATEGLEPALRLMQQLAATTEDVNQAADDLGVPACDSR